MSLFFLLIKIDFDLSCFERFVNVYYMFHMQCVGYTKILLFCFSRFGSFEEFKKRSVSADGTLSTSKKLLCGLGEFRLYVNLVK